MGREYIARFPARSPPEALRGGVNFEGVEKK